MSFITLTPLRYLTSELVDLRAANANLILRRFARRASFEATSAPANAKRTPIGVLCVVCSDLNRCHPENTVFLMLFGRFLELFRVVLIFRYSSDTVLSFLDLTLIDDIKTMLSARK